MGLILPSEPTAVPPQRPAWSALHARLHRALRREPQLLPAGTPLLLALSGGQDSMAMTRLLQDLQRLHHWSLHAWHGDHGWRRDSARQAEELSLWARGCHLPIQLERADNLTAHEAAARRWRYERLEAEARRLGCRHVLTAHTASDRAETLLLHLARGSHRAGLASLRRQRPLSPGSAITLVRPLLAFSRTDTAAICERWQLPIWHDSSNDSLRYARNRVRQQVLPQLEAIHPGASGRISALMERLAQEHEQEGSADLLELALERLQGGADSSGGLDRRRLTALGAASQRQLLQHWIQRTTGLNLAARELESLVRRLEPACGPGQLDLRGGRRLVWDRTIVSLDEQHPGP
jgi:tRNA(Ile)-lysidine synthase